MSLSLCLSVSLYLSLILYVSPSLSLSISLYIYIYISLSLSLYPSLPPSLPPSILWVNLMNKICAQLHLSLFCAFPWSLAQSTGLKKLAQTLSAQTCRTPNQSQRIQRVKKNSRFSSGTGIDWKATKEYLNLRVPKSEFFECAFRPLSSHPFSPPLSPSRPVHSPTTSPLFTSPFIHPFLTPRKLRYRYPSDLGTL